MAEADLEAGLRSLRDSLRQMKTLLAWEQLKQSESRPDQPPAFTICDPIETDLKNEYSFFLSTAVQMHSILSDGSVLLSESDRQNIRRQLVRIEQQAYGLSLHQRFSTS
jgi:hypothetical protein